MSARPLCEPLHVLTALGEYEEALSDMQRAYRRLVAAPLAERAGAEGAYAAALARARELGARLRVLREGAAA